MKFQLASRVAFALVAVSMVDAPVSFAQSSRVDEAIQASTQARQAQISDLMVKIDAAQKAVDKLDLELLRAEREAGAGYKGAVAIRNVSAAAAVGGLATVAVSLASLKLGLEKGSGLMGPLLSFGGLYIGANVTVWGGLIAGASQGAVMLTQDEIPVHRANLKKARKELSQLKSQLEQIQDAN